MNKAIKVTFRGSEVVEFEEGTTFKEIANYFKHNFTYDILVAQVDNDIVDLSDTLKKKCNINFFDRSSSLGNTIYMNSAVFILILAVKSVLGADLVTEHSVDRGVYCTVKDAKLTQSKLSEIYEKMREIVREDYLYTKLSVSRLDAIKYFKKLGRLDKVNVLKYISNTYINLYRINDTYDYFYSKMAYSTGQIDDFKLTYISENGFALTIPDIQNPEGTLDYKHHAKVFDKFNEYSEWGSILGINNAADLNKIVSEAKVGELVNLAEAHYDGQLAKIADTIYSGSNCIADSIEQSARYFTEDERELIAKYKDKQIAEAKALLKQWMQTTQASGCDNINIVADTENFLKE